MTDTPESMSGGVGGQGSGRVGGWIPRRDDCLYQVSFTVAVVTGLLFAVAPAVQMTSPSLAGALKEGGHGTTVASAGRRVRSVLVAAEIALAFVLLVASGLLMRTVFKLLEIDPGVKAIVSSGYSDNALLSEFGERGFVASLNKPYSIEELSDKLYEVFKLPI